MGWRIAMLLSALIVIPALLARYKLADTPLLERLRQQDQLSKLPSFDVVRLHARSIILLALVSAFQQMDGYVSGTYIIAFMHSAGIPLATTAVIIFISRIGDIAGVALSGPMADLLKRKTVAYLAIAVATALSYPFVLAILAKQVAAILVLQFLITLFGIGLLHGLAPIRGGIAPSLLAGLIGPDVAEKWYFVPIVYAIYCVVVSSAVNLDKKRRSKNGHRQ
jgi:hypothetical protein